jgi:kumamolisin
MIRMRRARLTAGILLGVGAVVAPLAGASGAAASSNQSPNTPTQVPGGINAAALPGASPFGDTPPGTPVTVSFVLKEQGISSLEAQVESGIPQSNYLSVSQFAARYGQPASNISALTSYLAGFGITTSVYPDDVNVVANGTAGDFDKALTITEQNVHVPQQAGFGGFGPIRAQNVYSPKQAPLLPYRLASFVTAILGLSNYGPFVSDIAKPSSDSKPQKNGPNACVTEFGLPNGCHLPSDFAKWYDLDPLYAKDATGAGQTLGIVTLAAVDTGAPQYFWDNISHTTRTGTFTVDSIDGGAPGPNLTAGSDETDLDIEQSGALAPGANVISYQAPNTDYGFSDGFFTAASQNVASTVSTSWGESETVIEAAVLSSQESSGLQAAYDEAFLEMAAQGQSMFVASGDEGAYAANADLGSTNVSIQTPSDSPYVTAAGGSTLPWTGSVKGTDGSAAVSVPAQRIWGWDYLWGPIAQANDVPLAEAAESNVEGSTGGFSSVYPTPSYQRNVSGTADFHAVQYLTPTDYTQVAPGLTEPIEWNFNATPSVTFGIGSGRAVPDISADADPETGYLVYGASVGGLNEYGGTSFVAPQLNGATAVIDSSLGHRVGFWNPAVYHAAASGFNAFTQLNATGTSNDNILYTGNPGQEYNQGVGLGLPDLAKLAGLFGAQLPF